MKIIIVGAGGHARIVHEILSHDRNMYVVAFIDNVSRSGQDDIKGIPILGDHTVIPGLIKSGVSGAIVAVSMNDIRAAHFAELTAMGLELINAIHPHSSVSASVKIGQGVTIAIGAVISTGVSIANNVIINTGAVIDHESRIEEHAHICSGCSLAGKITVKKGATVGIGSVLSGDVTIGRNAVIGPGTTITENVTVGENAIVRAGSVVLEDIPDNAVAAGAPAKVIRKA